MSQQPPRYAVKAILKEAIQHFTGTVIIVSYDRDYGLTEQCLSLIIIP